MLKKILLCAAVITVACWQADPRAFAKGPPGVQYTLHNLSASGSPMYATNEDEICIFCHTPHGGSLNGPLWNRELPTGAWSHYTSSTLSDYLRVTNINRAVNDESLLCLSCHDGALATNRVLNPSNDIGQPENSMSGGDQEILNLYLPGAFARIGDVYVDGFAQDETRNLTDDHPISFSYYDVELEKYNLGNYGLRRPNAPELTTAPERPRFFGAGAVAGGMRVECSTCHDPHVDYGDPWMSPNAGDSNYTRYAPFLIMSNSGSALCLACHDK
jgi:hypothetical protein